MKILVKIQNWPKRGNTIPSIRTGGRLWTLTWNETAQAYVFDTPTLADVNRCFEDFRKASHIALGICVEVGGELIAAYAKLDVAAEITKPAQEVPKPPEAPVAEEQVEEPVTPAVKAEKPRRRRG